MKRTVAQIVEAVRRTADNPTVNDRGNTIYRGFAPTDRYIVDFADDFKSDGWMQFDTDQDAHYFGVWVNPSKRLTLTYAEGDWTLVECPDADHYNAEIEDACKFYGEGFIAKAYDFPERPGGTVTKTTYVQDRKELFLPQEDATDDSHHPATTGPARP